MILIYIYKNVQESVYKLVAILHVFRMQLVWTTLATSQHMDSFTRGVNAHVLKQTNEEEGKWAKYPSLFRQATVVHWQTLGRGRRSGRVHFLLKMSKNDTLNLQRIVNVSSDGATRLELFCGQFRVTTISKREDAPLAIPSA